MKKISLCVFTMGLCHFVWGQNGGDESAVIPRAKAVDTVEEAGRVLNRAGAAGKIEAERISLDQSAGRTRLDQAVGKTRSMPETRSGDTERTLIDDVNRKLNPALSRVAPEGKAIIAQSSAAPVMRAPVVDDAAALPEKADEGGAAVPLARAPRDSEAAVPATPKTGKADTTSDSHIDIVCQGALYFDSAQSMAVFTDDVVVNHPQFHLTCDELQVYMLKDNEAGPKGAAATPPAGTGEAPKPKQDSSVKQAIATGRKVVIEKRTETGELQVGISRSATYIGESGDIILRDMPQVQRARNLIIATDPSTYMVLKQNGELKVFGRSRTEIIQEAAKKDKTPAAAGQPVPVPKPLPVGKPGSTTTATKDTGTIKKKDKGATP